MVVRWSAAWSATRAVIPRFATRMLVGIVLAGLLALVTAPVAPHGAAAATTADGAVVAAERADPRNAEGWDTAGDALSGLTTALAQPGPATNYQEPEGVCSDAWIHTLHAARPGQGAKQATDRVTIMGGAGGFVTSAVGAVPDDAEIPDDPVTDPNVRYPHDPYFRLYQRDNLMAIGALDAWDTSRGAMDVTIAVISTGVDYRHPDLAAKIWRNEDEIEGNGIDDDENGYVDDVRGWNFASLGDDTHDPMDAPKYGKGTLMAGIAAAHTNNGEGIAGVSWGASIMPLKTMVLVEDERGAFFVGSVRSIVESVCYAANNGARVILIGGYLFDPESAVDDVDLLRQAIDYAHRAGAVVVAPAGDCAEPQQRFCPPEKYGTNPTIIPAAFSRVIGVQSYARGVVRRAEASYGPWVDITAPGEGFRATGAGGTYLSVKPQRATSDFGAAHIAGVVAVMRSVNDYFSPLQVEMLLCETADRKVGGPYEGPGPRNDEWGCGVVDFERAVELTPPVIRVGPTEVRVVTDGTLPWPIVAFDNPYLRAAKWVVNPRRGTWLLPEPVDDLRDTISRAAVQADLDRLRAEQGPLQSGSTYTATLDACPLGWEDRVDEDRLKELCQEIPYELVFVDRFESTLYLPLGTKP